MNVLIVGSGGREHALAWKVAQSSQVDNVYVSPGNAGTALEAKVTNLSIAADDISELLRFARGHDVDLTIVGPEAPLVLGIVDTFTQAGLHCFGPTRSAAQLEGSKAFAKEFMTHHHIPTAAFRTFTELEPALAYIRNMGAPIVVKADGLAAGKGVIVAHTESEAQAAVQAMLSGSAFGKAGQQVVIEEFLAGEEVSFTVMVAGKHILPMAASQDHKARDNGDQGPNTGGMGAYSPTPAVTTVLHQRILKEIIEPTVAGMAAEGYPYTGFLYAGLMITSDGMPKVLEYNCRLGDPEAQPLLMRLRSDLVALCEVALEERLDQVQAEWDSRAALGIVLAAKGYPGEYAKGDRISGLPAAEEEDSKLFHGGTVRQNDDIVTSGGRVCCATALGNTVQEAQARAYQLAKQVSWKGVYYRTDIGYRAVTREQVRE
jgi:phosphoribosylamine--glycine ligase